MATGQWLLNKLNSKGGRSSGYADIVFGQVTSEKPLKVQISNNLILSDNFLILSKDVQDYKETIKYKNDKNQDIEREIEVKNGLKKNDYVTMLRRDGGQQFFILEKTAKGGSDQ